MAHAHCDTWACGLAVTIKQIRDGDHEVTITAGGVKIAMRRDEAAHLAADLLDAVGATSFESTEVLPPAVEGAIARNGVQS